MSDEKKYTERDLVLAKQEAFVEGSLLTFRHFDCSLGSEAGLKWRGSSNLAAERYPLPKVTRPRVVQDPHERGMRWRVLRDKDQHGVTYLEYNAFNTGADASWRTGLGTYCATAERVALWADLLANPTEEVDA